MKNEMTFDNDYNFQAKGFLNEEYSRLDHEKIRGWLNAAIKELNEILENYKISLADDGKITGEERSRLMKEIDDFFNILISFYVYITEDEDKIFEINIPNYDFRITISVTKNIWTGHGIYPEAFMQAPKNFLNYYKETITWEFKNLISTFKDFPLDDLSKVPRDVLIQLKQTLKKLVYHLLKTRFQIEKCMINE